ncbi:MAG TPA: DUF998 domain-containing protein [Rhizomicrobium sp.]|nr:DUF998 domain-containing protein [Rhizomicrobium sp.]
MSQLMKTETRLIFGPVAAAIFFVGVTGLALLIPGYSHVQQSISVIGKLGTPLRIPFSLVIACYACSLLIFASGIFQVAAKTGSPKLPAYMIGYYAFTQLGIAVFATPHPLHNVFGLLSMLGYLAPLTLAFTWRRIGPHSLIVISYLLGLVVLVAIVLGLSELFPQLGLWQLVSPYPGLVQRLLVAGWLPWFIAASVIMRRQQSSSASSFGEAAG